MPAVRWRSGSTSATRPQAERERILVIRFSSLGDILLTAPTVRALRKRFVDGEIVLLVAKEYSDAASLIPGIDRVLTFDRQTGFRGLWQLRNALSRRFSILVDLHNSLRSALLRTSTFPVIWVKARRYRLQRWILVRFKWNLYRRKIPVPVRYLEAVSSLGAEDDGCGLELNVPRSARDAVEPLLGASGAPMIAMCPGARHFTKRWPSDRWIELGRQFQRDGFRIIVTGAAEERSLIDEIAEAIVSATPLIGRPVSEVAAVLERCQAVISNDSGLMHLAAGVHTPVVAIFGPTVEEFGFYPFRARSRVIEQDLTCRPCSAMGTDRCKEGHFRCMLDTTPQMVAEAANSLITAERRHRT